MNKSDNLLQQLLKFGTKMVMKEVVVSALQALTSDEFERSSFVDNSTLEALVTEYFGGSDDDTDVESVWSDDEEIRKLINNYIPELIVLFVGLAPMEEQGVQTFEGTS